MGIGERYWGNIVSVCPKKFLFFVFVFLTTLSWFSNFLISAVSVNVNLAPSLELIQTQVKFDPEGNLYTFVVVKNRTEAIIRPRTSRIEYLTNDNVVLRSVLGASVDLNLMYPGQRSATFAMFDATKVDKRTMEAVNSVVWTLNTELIDWEPKYLILHSLEYKQHSPHRVVIEAKITNTSNNCYATKDWVDVQLIFYDHDGQVVATTITSNIYSTIIPGSTISWSSVTTPDLAPLTKEVIPKMQFSVSGPIIYKQSSDEENDE